MTKPSTPILEWLVEEQAGLEGKAIAEVAGISPATWSKVRQGKQDLSSDLVWRVMCAIAHLRPRSACAEVVQVIEGKKFRLDRRLSLAEIIEASTEEELEAMMVLIVRKMFPNEKKAEMLIG